MHTPGPWTYMESESGKPWIQGSDTDPNGWRTIATMGQGIEPKVQKANGSLIAAAPDLLEACKMLRNELRKYEHGPGNHGVLKLSLEAIDKAEIG